MSELSSYMHVLEVNYACDDCSKKLDRSYGCILKATGIVLTSNPPQYGFECPNCSRIYYFNEIYPLIRYVRKEDQGL